VISLSSLFDETGLQQTPGVNRSSGMESNTARNTAILSA